MATLKLEPHEVSIILKALQELPYHRVAALIRKIVGQTNIPGEEE